MNQRLASIPKAIIDRIPESIARENTVVPIEASLETITIAAAIDDTADDWESIIRDASLLAKLEFILQCEVKLEAHTRGDIQSAIDRHYTYEALIENCHWSIKNRCPQLWFNLTPTDDRDIRYCDVCSRQVYYCKSRDQIDFHSAIGNCIAINNDNGPCIFESCTIY